MQQRTPLILALQWQEGKQKQSCPEARWQLNLNMHAAHCGKNNRNPASKWVGRRELTSNVILCSLNMYYNVHVCACFPTHTFTHIFMHTHMYTRDDNKLKNNKNF